MVFLRYRKLFNFKFNFLLAIAFMSFAGMLSSHFNLKKAELEYIPMSGKAGKCNHCINKPFSIRLIQAYPRQSASHNLKEHILFYVEEEWDVFFTLIPALQQTNLVSLNFNPCKPWTTRLFFRASKLYLHHRSMLC